LDTSSLLLLIENGQGKEYMTRIVRCKERELNNDRTEDILASLAKLHADLSVAQQAIGYLQGATSKMHATPETAQRALTYLESAMASSQTRCKQLQRQVIEVTEYPYGREPEEVMA
jgi:hypothetical protein